MARARNIKPKFFTNEELVELSFGTRLLFIGLWTIADRAGRLEDRPKKIKMELFPADDFNVDGALNELQASGFILRYEHDGKRYIQILNFTKHQNPHRDERQSTIPAPCGHCASTVQEPEEHDGNRADSLIPDSLIPDSGFPQPDSPAPVAAATTPRRAKARAEDQAEEFEPIWQAYPRKPGMSRANTLKAFSARLTEGAKVPDILLGVQAYAAYCQAMGTEPQFIKSPETFLGPGKHWLSDWTVPARAGPPPPQQLTKAGQATARNMEAWLERKRQEQGNA